MIFVVIIVICSQSKQAPVIIQWFRHRVWWSGGVNQSSSKILNRRNNQNNPFLQIRIVYKCKNQSVLLSSLFKMELLKWMNVYYNRISQFSEMHNLEKYFLWIIAVVLWDQCHCSSNGSSLLSQCSFAYLISLIPDRQYGVLSVQQHTH